MAHETAFVLPADVLLVPVAELAPEAKNRVSHRAQAARALRELLVSVWKV